MAAGLGFKEFTTGDVLTAADANGYLASQVVMVFASASARTSAISSPQEGMFSYLKDTNSTEYYSGSAWVAIGGGGGKVLQVVQASYSTSTTVASTSLTDTGLSASITPSATSSKILIFVNQPANFERFSAPMGFNLNIFRNTTNIFAQNGSGNTGSLYADGSYVQIRQIAAFSYLDSPSTTSAITYKTQGSASTTANSGAVTFQSGSAIATITLMEIGA
jgi:hypothetical protein